MGAASLSPLLNSCAYFDRLILGDSNDDTQRVVVLGAGAAGLMAAYQLKRKGIPFRLFEGSHRVGGRAYTLENFNSSDQAVEVGGEWISADHDIVFNLAKELRVLVGEEKEILAAPALLYEGKQISWENLRQELRPLSATWHRYELSAWDNQAASALIERWSKESSAASVFLLKRWIQMEWGTDPENISAAQVMRHLQNNHDLVHYLQNRRYRIRGGTQVLMNALFDRISGVIPDRFVKKEFRLIAVRDKGNYIQLSFQTPAGIQDIKASTIICALPFSVLREVDGIEDLNFAPGTNKIISEIGYGTHSKVIASYPQRFWRNQRWYPRVATDTDNQWLWESGLQLTPLTGANRGIMTAQMSGKTGSKAGLHSLEILQKELLEKSKLPGVAADETHVMNWSQAALTKGSISYFKPGQWTVWADRLGESHYRGYWVFAGEHTSARFPGTLAGALESGSIAADKITALQLQFSETRDG